MRTKTFKISNKAGIISRARIQYRKKNTKVYRTRIVIAVSKP
jgi:hypothetical protein